MERSAWTDQRLDDRFDRIDAGLSEVRQDMRELRGEIRDGFTEVRGEIAELRTIVLRTNAAMLIGLLGIIAAILARGA